MRPGEKLFEELSTSGEKITKTKHPKIFIGAFEPYSSSELSKALDGFRTDCETANEYAIRERISAMLPEARIRRVRKDIVTRHSSQPSKSALTYVEKKPEAEELQTQDAAAL